MNKRSLPPTKNSSNIHDAIVKRMPVTVLERDRLRLAVRAHEKARPA